MATTTPSRPYKTPCDRPAETCPECGGLECLCRPRFFAGQLLTEEDLNLLDHYIVAKNKLHNRYLFGWGVVCGLEVVCHACNMVAVRPGYALSPCGEDIVVCKETPVDICSLINACRKGQLDPCAPYDPARKDDCQDTNEKWILSIRYHEAPTRGVTALKGDSGSACCSRCSCGGGSSCGCKGTSSKQSPCSCGGGCGGVKSACSCQTTKPRKQPRPQCEPTVVCESYTFEVCKLPPGQEPVDLGALIDAINCCDQLRKKYTVSPPVGPTLAEAKAWCCSVRDGLAELFACHPGHTCTLAELIGTLCTDPPAGTPPANYINDVLTKTNAQLDKFMHDCMCSALLPPCPGPVNDDRIFLATVTVRKRDCKILEICNWDQRRFAVTFPMLRYWLSWLPFGKDLKKAIADFCCVPFQMPAGAVNQQFRNLNRDFADRANAAQPPLKNDMYSRQLGSIALNAMLNPDRSVTPNTFSMASLGVVGPDGGPLLTPEEMSNPGATLIIHQFLRPLLTKGLAGQFAGTFLRGDNSKVHALQDEVNSLRAAVDDLRARIDNR
jgi:hypothetical protein